jgi:Fur family transcriptional regulator, stress-responsive regulator
VYQTLNDLAELGAISVLDVGTGSARFDPNVENTHHHLVCRSCGKVRDLAADLPGLTVSARGAQGFVVDSAEVVFRGLCDECRGSQISLEPQRPSERKVRTSHGSTKGK